MSVKKFKTVTITAPSNTSIDNKYEYQGVRDGGVIQAGSINSKTYTYEHIVGTQRTVSFVWKIRTEDVDINIAVEGIPKKLWVSNPEYLQLISEWNGETVLTNLSTETTSPDPVNFKETHNIDVSVPFSFKLVPNDSGLESPSSETWSNIYSMAQSGAFKGIYAGSTLVSSSFSDVISGTVKKSGTSTIFSINGKQYTGVSTIKWVFEPTYEEDTSLNISSEGLQEDDVIEVSILVNESIEGSKKYTISDDGTTINMNNTFTNGK